MNWLKLVACAVLAIGTFAFPVNADEQSKLQADANQWTSPTGNYFNHRYSKLDQINKSNVGSLKVAWTFQPANSVVTKVRLS